MSDVLSRAFLGWMSRGQLFAGLLIIPCANGLAGRMISAVRGLGWDAVLAGFTLSAIVWLAMLASLYLLRRADGDGPIKAPDVVVGATVLALTAMPVPTLSWVALTLSSIYISRASRAGSPLQRASLICLALTAPMVWGPTLMDAYFEPFQRVDALLVSGLTGTHRLGNLVRLADGSGYLMIGLGCSSFHNVSLAILGWVTANEAVGMKRSVGQLFWCLLACASVLAVNVIRISLIGLHPEHYQAIHGEPGETVANWISLGLIGVICYFESQA